MYKNLLVPIDGSQLSQATVEHAVALARSCDAHITFFYARPDFAATSDGALMHVTEPVAFIEGAAGNARALLSKAEASARAAKIECKSVTVISDRPHEAILEAASSHGCDLIFMASHGRRGIRGLLHSSVMQKVLQHAKLPVLVNAVESNLKLSNEQRAVATIKDEHRSIAAVIHALQQVLKELTGTNVKPDFDLIRAMLFYIEEFPERLHHPKEDAYLFQKLQQRTDECNALIAELQSQHQEGTAQFSNLRDVLTRYESGEPHSAADFSAVVEMFAAFQWHHMSAEEDVLLPAASRHLTSDDWSAIASAFHENADPRFASQSDDSFTDLLTRVLNISAQSAGGKRHIKS
ncbi:MAG: hypothetical protein RL295_666 [Pseudomonadota bacterium]|jgi:nucleotide-binding universal stress UspA family protein/hemerythrin-like domain-containing protein